MIIFTLFWRWLIKPGGLAKMNLADVPGYEGYYQVSKCGRVFSIRKGSRTWAGRELIPFKRSRGYQYVCLCKDGVQKKPQIHRLVASAFIPNPESLPKVNHMDGDKTNNNVKNLEWCCHRYNMNHAINNGLLRTTPVIGVSMKTGDVLSFPSGMAVKRNGFSQSHISACCKGTRRKHKGFAWHYADQALVTSQVMMS